MALNLFGSKTKDDKNVVKKESKNGLKKEDKSNMKKEEKQEKANKVPITNLIRIFNRIGSLIYSDIVYHFQIIRLKDKDLLFYLFFDKICTASIQIWVEQNS